MMKKTIWGGTSYTIYFPANDTISFFFMAE
jgi:hypothetical protein